MNLNYDSKHKGLAKFMIDYLSNKTIKKIKLNDDFYFDFEKLITSKVIKNKKNSNKTIDEKILIRILKNAEKNKDNELTYTKFLLLLKEEFPTESIEQKNRKLIITFIKKILNDKPELTIQQTNNINILKLIYLNEKTKESIIF